MPLSKSWLLQFTTVPTTPYWPAPALFNSFILLSLVHVGIWVYDPRTKELGVWEDKKIKPKGFCVDRKRKVRRLLGWGLGVAFGAEKLESISQKDF